MKRKKYRGLSCALVNGDNIQPFGFGYADITNKMLATGENPYCAGSILKLFTAVSVTQ